MIVTPQSALKAFLTRLLGDTGSFTGAMKVRLFANNIVPSPGSVYTDFTEATFDGYAASSVVVWTAAVIDDAGNPVSLGDMKTFTMTGSTTPNLVYGYYITDDPATKLFFAELLPTPKSMQVSGDFLSIVPEYGLVNET